MASLGVLSEPTITTTSRSDGDAAASTEQHGAPALTRGAAVGRYVILERIGMGGMGVVYSAYDYGLDRRVALKFLHVGKPGADAHEHELRLLREAKAMARLQHPNVVVIHDVGRASEHLFVAMEYVEGDTLADWLKQPRTLHEITGVFLQAARGLAAAHAAGLVHGDFKPDNVLVGRDGRVRVTDFGLARSASEQMSGGTPEYMAPEQRAGRADARADQYSFCVALKQALGGVRAPELLSRVLEKGLGHDPRARHASMQPLERALAMGAARRDRGRLAWVVAMAGCAAVGLAVLARFPSPGEGRAAARDRLVPVVVTSPPSVQYVDRPQLAAASSSESAASVRSAREDHSAARASASDVRSVGHAALAAHAAHAPAPAAHATASGRVASASQSGSTEARPGSGALALGGGAGSSTTTHGALGSGLPSGAAVSSGSSGGASAAPRKSAVDPAPSAPTHAAAPTQIATGDFFALGATAGGYAFAYDMVDRSGVMISPNSVEPLFSGELLRDYPSPLVAGGTLLVWHDGTFDSAAQVTKQASLIAWTAASGPVVLGAHTLPYAAAVSADGDSVAFFSVADDAVTRGDLIVRSLSKGTSRTLLSAVPLSTYAASQGCFPTLAFTSERLIVSHCAGRLAAVESFNLATGERLELMAPALNAFQLDPTGRQALVYDEDSNAWLVSVGDSESTWSYSSVSQAMLLPGGGAVVLGAEAGVQRVSFAGTAPLTLSPFGISWFYFPSPDGRYLLGSSTSVADWQRGGVANLVLLSATQPGPPATLTTSATPIAFTADSSHVLFLSGSAQAGDGALIAQPVDGRPAVTLGRGVENVAALDGARVIYLEVGADGTGNLSLTDLAKPDPPLQLASSVSSFVTSPDGAAVIYTTRAGVFVMPLR